MANSKISALAAATTPLAGTEVLPVVQSSATTQVTVANLTAGRSVSGSNFVVTSSTIPANGVYLPAANSVGISTNSTLRATIDASGNVGIGVATPSSKLQVSESKNGGSVEIIAANTYYLATSVDESVSFQGEFYQDNVAANRAAGYMRFTKVGDFSSNANASANIIFATRNAGTLAEKFRIESTGNVLVTGAGGLGYGTGSGGTVTQATSRTTGVTLNKTNGAITLVSSAGLATFQSFTVTNSTVAATDVVRVTQKSGTDLYQIFVTATAAGSFQITYATTGGITVEQPVFNFAVIKGVTA
jgi:hypothetical protein